MKLEVGSVMNLCKGRLGVGGVFKVSGNRLLMV